MAVYYFTIVMWLFLQLKVRSSFCNNIALGKPVIQGSTYESHVAERAVDGNRTQDVHSCTHTLDTASWWIVDLLHVYNVERVVIYNRDNYKDRLDNLTIDGFLQQPLLCPDVSSQSCGFNAGPSGDIIIVTCSPGFQARFLKLKTPGGHSLCEVEVFGPKLEADECTRSLIKTTKNTSLKNSTLSIGNTPTRLSCAVHCRKTPQCLVFSYNALTKECQMSDGLVGPDETLSVDGWELCVTC